MDDLRASDFSLSFGLLAILLSSHIVLSSGRKGHLTWLCYPLLDEMRGPGLLGCGPGINDVVVGSILSKRRSWVFHIPTRFKKHAVLACITL